MRCNPTVLADPRPVEVKDERKRRTGKGEKCWDARGPVDAKSGVHVRRKHGEGSRQQRSHDRASREDRGSVQQIRINEIVVDRHENEDHAKSKDTAGRDTGQPMRRSPVGPREPE